MQDSLVQYIDGAIQAVEEAERQLAAIKTSLQVTRQALDIRSQINQDAVTLSIIEQIHQADDMRFREPQDMESRLARKEEQYTNDRRKIGTFGQYIGEDDSN